MVARDFIECADMPIALLVPACVCTIYGTTSLRLQPLSTHERDTLYPGHPLRSNVGSAAAARCVCEIRSLVFRPEMEDVRELSKSTHEEDGIVIYIAMPSV